MPHRVNSIVCLEQAGFLLSNGCHVGYWLPAYWLVCGMAALLCVTLLGSQYDVLLTKVDLYNFQLHHDG